MTFIIRDVPIDDLLLAIRAAKYLSERPSQKDAIVAYEGAGKKCFYVRRNKSSITIRPC